MFRDPFEVAQHKAKPQNQNRFSDHFIWPKNEESEPKQFVSLILHSCIENSDYTCKEFVSQDSKEHILIHIGNYTINGINGCILIQILPLSLWYYSYCRVNLAQACKVKKNNFMGFEILDILLVRSTLNLWLIYTFVDVIF